MKIFGFISLTAHNDEIATLQLQLSSKQDDIDSRDKTIKRLEDLIASLLKANNKPKQARGGGSGVPKSPARSPNGTKRENTRPPAEVVAGGPDEEDEAAVEMDKFLEAMQKNKKNRKK